MLDINSLVFLLLVGLGGMVQTITGFAMGLIIMGGVTALGLAPLAETAAVVSVISLVNTLVALRRCHKLINFAYVRLIAATLLPALIAGVLILDYFVADYYDNLRMLLGGVIVSAGILLMLTPAPYQAPSGPGVKMFAGLTAGLMGGMYGAGGAPLAYLMYRQPLAVNVVRASLLFLFSLSTSGRMLVVGFSGQINSNIVLLSLLAIPLVILVTILTARINHLLPDALVRRFVFVLLILLGLFLLSGLGLG